MKPIIEVNRLSKKYKYGETQSYLALRDVLANSFKAPLKMFSISSKLQKNEFWALKDISLKVSEGEVLGIIGPNGAGKSTLLKILSRITPPSKGDVIIRGRVGSLLEVGTGFHPELTGRENIYLNGAILGMNRGEINRKFDEIVSFAEIEKFLDTPVKHYSSGMYMRLAFSVAAHLEPEILMVDEVLAVGDAEFQKKCLGKMNDVSKKQGRTILFISHNMVAINNLCSKAIELDSGQIISSGNTSKVISNYLNKNKIIINNDLSKRRDRTGLGRVVFSDVYFEDANNKKISNCISGRPLTICCKYSSSGKEKLKDCVVALVFFNESGQRMFKCSSEVANKSKLNLPPKGVVKCFLPKLPLTQANYSINLFLSVGGDVEDSLPNAVVMSVLDGVFFTKNIETPSDWRGLDVLVDHNWFFD